MRIKNTMRKLLAAALAGTLLALSAFAAAPQTSTAESNMNTEKIPQISAFPLGNPNTGYAQYFSGRSWLAGLTKHAATTNVPISNVTFEPGCRNNWHSHTGGQILIAVGGKGFYQEKGKPAQLLVPGDVVEILPNVVHWHGAAPDAWFAHLAIACNPQTNKNTWLEPVSDAEYAEATADYSASAPAAVPAAGTLALNDPELAAIFSHFLQNDVLKNSAALDAKTRAMVTLASCIAQHALGEYENQLPSALAAGVSPAELKEVLYQAVPYVGMAKVRDFVPATYEFLAKNGVALPLPSLAASTPETRFEVGLEKQVALFGEGMRNARDAAPANQRHIRDFLSANCFGDFVARGGLDDATRELLTFSMLISLGGCEPQVKAHVAGNVAAGNDKEKLIAAVTAIVPYIGYPRSLNALSCLNEVVPENR